MHEQNPVNELLIELVDDFSLHYGPPGGPQASGPMSCGQQIKSGVFRTTPDRDRAASARTLDKLRKLAEELNATWDADKKESKTLPGTEYFDAGLTVEVVELTRIAFVAAAIGATNSPSASCC